MLETVTHICPECLGVFEGQPRQIYCSRACKNAVKARRAREIRNEPSVPQSRRKLPESMRVIYETAKQAQESGMSYGNFVARRTK